MTTVGTYEAKTHLPRFLKRASRGETIIITSHGHPVAKLVPADARPEMTVDEAISGIRQFSRGRKLQGLSVRKMVNEGRRF